ncbi:hypothetical protein [Pantoea allii]|uniref:hypothetical protein n=1 Tax=Pantoea allii TaxID=574096 RepID=UPI001F4DA328|nr:hypothetical protein [Pantoea allii]MCH9300444.1 hypothetical protein [Pantoea allii]
MLSTRSLDNALFNNELNDFCRKYFIKGPINPTSYEMAIFPDRYNNMKSVLFESFILNDEVNFKVEGENLPLCMMLNEIGLKGVEELIEQQALSFTLWDTMILKFEKNIKGAWPLAAGRHSEGPYVDPEESIELGLMFMSNPLKRREARLLKRKLRDRYLSVPEGLEQSTVHFAHSALDSGKFERLGLKLNGREKDELTTSEKNLLLNCANDLLGYNYVACKHASTSSTSNIQALLEDSFTKKDYMSKEGIFSTILEFEHFPDIKKAFESMGQPMDELIRLRSNKNSKKFRHWIRGINEAKSPMEVLQIYNETIAHPKGFFETRWGKATKYVSMGFLGYYVGQYVPPEVGGQLMPYLGPTLGPTLASPLTDVMFDAADKYLISKITQGWTPKLFIDDIRKLNFKYSV